MMPFVAVPTIDVLLMLGELLNVTVPVPVLLVTDTFDASDPWLACMLSPPIVDVPVRFWKQNADLPAPVKFSISRLLMVRPLTELPLSPFSAELVPSKSRLLSVMPAVLLPRCSAALQFALEPLFTSLTQAPVVLVPSFLKSMLLRVTPAALRNSAPREDML